MDAWRHQGSVAAVRNSSMGAASRQFLPQTARQMAFYEKFTAVLSKLNGG